MTWNFQKTHQIRKNSRKVRLSLQLNSNLSKTAADSKRLKQNFAKRKDAFRKKRPRLQDYRMKKRLRGILTRP